MFETEELASQYASMVNEELLRLALKPEQLSPEAQLQLKVEMGRRGIDSPHRVKEFREEESLANFDPKQYSKRRWGFTGSLQDLARFHRQTGRWPILSAAAALTKTLAIWSSGVLVVLLSAHRNWSVVGIGLAILTIVVAESWLGDRIQKKVRLKEVQSYRRRRT